MNPNFLINMNVFLLGSVLLGVSRYAIWGSIGVRHSFQLFDEVYPALS